MTPFEQFRQRYEQWWSEQWQINYRRPDCESVTAEAFGEVAETMKLLRASIGKVEPIK